MKTTCPECGSDIAIPPDALPGELLICGHCAVELELISTDPVAVAVFEEEEK